MLRRHFQDDFGLGSREKPFLQIGVLTGEMAFGQFGEQAMRVALDDSGIALTTDAAVGRFIDGDFQAYAGIGAQLPCDDGLWLRAAQKGAFSQRVPQ